MGSGASSNRSRATENAVVYAGRWKWRVKADECPIADGDGDKPDGNGSVYLVNKKRHAEVKDKGKPSEQKSCTGPPGSKNSSSSVPAKQGTKCPPGAGAKGSSREGNSKRKKSVQPSVGTDLSQRVDRVLCGAIEDNCPVNSKIIRIFLSSTFTDTENERNALMEHVYPKLRRFCLKKGYEFQVVDMRWGVRDEATNLHMTTELCLREIRACQEISVGPNFVTLLSEKYGFCPLLPSINCYEFEELLMASSDDNSKALLNRWFEKDENCIPASYILQPVSKWIPNYFNDDNPELKEEARDQWHKEFTAMRTFLQHTAKQVFKEKEVWHKYVRSATKSHIVLDPLPYQFIGT